MPTYDYVCDACGHAFELVQSMKDAPIKQCPKCKKAKVRRLLGTGGGILFKGSGFYQTDYRSSSYKEKAAKENSPAAPAPKTEKPSKPESGGSSASPPKKK